MDKGFILRGGSLIAPSYGKWRKFVMNRGDWKCSSCGSIEKLEADHIISRKQRPDLHFDVNNGRVLCKPCHSKTATYGGNALRGQRKEKDPYGTR